MKSVWEYRIMTYDDVNNGVDELCESIFCDSKFV